jgi:hypothetical protein
MQLIVMLVIALLIGPPTAAGAGASNCGQATEFAAAGVRWAAVRQSRGDTTSNEKNCRAYSIQVYEAVTARQASPPARMASVVNPFSTCSTPRSTPLTTSSRRSARAKRSTSPPGQAAARARDSIA